jgi:hypothetical protein
MIIRYNYNILLDIINSKRCKLACLYLYRFSLIECTVNQNTHAIQGHRSFLVSFIYFLSIQFVK